MPEDLEGSRRNHWDILDRWGSLMTALITTGVVVSGLAGFLPYVTTKELSLRIVPVETEVKEIEGKLDELITLDRQDRVEQISRELREIDRGILDAKSRIESGEGNPDTEALIKRLEKDEENLRRRLKRLGI